MGWGKRLDLLDLARDALEAPMTRQRPLAIARGWLWFILLGTLVGTTVGLVASMFVPPTYAGRATLLVAPLPRIVALTNGDIEVTRAAAATLSQLATTGPVLERVIRTTGADTDVVELQKVVTTRVPVGTSLLDISVTSKTAEEAAALANAIAAELVTYPTPDTSDGSSAWQVTVTVVDPAVQPKVREGLGLGLSTLLAAGIALLMSICLAFIIENLRTADLENLRTADLETAGDERTGVLPAQRYGGPETVEDRGDIRRSTG